MKTSIVKRYGAPEIVEVVDRARPEPGAGEVLVRIEAVAVTSGDARIRAGRFPGASGCRLAWRSECADPGSRCSARRSPASSNASGRQSTDSQSVIRSPG
ncbi:hypothetical protein [Leucobacter soli]|uniref:hypothetical protein n=1 Tax=Leucobacter soli TaxID=2812850 RepID=UPI00360FDFB1